ncbi:MAG TPA: DUF2269 family protein [Solirubrobacteraceae bacterium]|nr:DUF2269 family protein [Solirubrobacteraceae bacterium]
MFAALYDWLLFLHILAAMFWVGGITAVGAFAVRILRTKEPGATAGFLGNLRVIGPLVLAPAPVILLGMGIWMVAEQWEFDQTWVSLGFGLFLVAFLIGAAHQSRAAIAAEKASKAGDDDAALRHLRRWAYGMAVILVLLVVATWDMVFKPGL